MRILFTICGRAGSKGIANKNIRNFLDRSLPYYTLSAIDLYQKSYAGHQADVVVNTDSEELVLLMEDNPFFAVDVIRRDPSLGGDDVPKTAVISDCLKQMQKKKEIRYDMVVDLDLTSPLRTSLDIHNLIDTHSKKHPDVTFSVTDARRNPYFNMVKKTDRGVKRALESDFTTRQQAPVLFDMNASLYAYDPAYLETGKGVLDGYCECIYMYDTGILDLDHENDFELMEVIAGHLFRTRKEFGEIYENIR